MSKAPAPPKLTAPPTMKAPPSAAMSARSAYIPSNKTFTIADWHGSNEGEKIIVYGRSGIGKTTLASMTPDPVWIGIDDGGRKIRNPVTGKTLRYIPGIDTFDDVRSALRSNVFDECKTIVVDTITYIQALAQEATFRRVKLENGGWAENIEDYGFHKGYRHWYDTMRYLLDEFDVHVRAGRNIVLLAQRATIKRANPGGEDFICEAPDLYNDRGVSILDAYIAWADHVLRVDHANVIVNKQKKAGSANIRAVYVHPEIHFEAKSRTIPTEYAVVQYAEPKDDSIWRLIF